jgi:hypothetical protein
MQIRVPGTKPAFAGVAVLAPAAGSFYGGGLIGRALWRKPALTSFVLDAEGRVVQKHVGLCPRLVYDLEVRALAGLPVDAVVERCDDAGGMGPGQRAQATEVPGVDLSGLTPDARAAVLARLNTDGCPCGSRSRSRGVARPIPRAT